MIERQAELGRRNMRKLKMRKLKVKLAKATGEAREKILYKINRISPWWTEAPKTPVAKAEPKEPREPKKKPPAPKGPPKEKAAK